MAQRLLANYQLGKARRKRRRRTDQHTETEEWKDGASQEDGA